MKIDIDTLQAEATLIVVVLGAAAALGRLVVLPIWRWGRYVVRVLDAAHHQLVPNGGSSLRDAINRIEGRVAAAEAADAEKIRLIAEIRSDMAEHLHEHAKAAEITELAREGRIDRRGGTTDGN